MLTVDLCEEIDKIVWLIAVNTDVGRERRLVVRRLRCMIERGDVPDPLEVDEHLRSTDVPASMVRQIVKIYRELLGGRVLLDYGGQRI